MWNTRRWQLRPAFLSLPTLVLRGCSGHGGSWGVKKDNFETALKVGLPTARAALKNVNENDARWVVSECPLAATHIAQVVPPPPPPFPSFRGAKLARICVS